jgi:hypothetical protein
MVIEHTIKKNISDTLAFHLWFNATITRKFLQIVKMSTCKAGVGRTINNFIKCFSHISFSWPGNLLVDHLYIWHPLRPNWKPDE